MTEIPFGQSQSLGNVMQERNEKKEKKEKAVAQ